jgi:hypothetical protein
MSGGGSGVGKARETRLDLLAVGLSTCMIEE